MAIDLLKYVVWKTANGGVPTDKSIGPAPILHADDALAQGIKSLVVNIDTVQTGSGDPSPENVRPLTGWTGATVTVCGKNLFDKSRFGLLPSFELITDPESASYGYYRGNATQLGNATTSPFSVTYNDPTKAGFIGKTPMGQIPTTISFDYRAIGSAGRTRFYYMNGNDSGNTYQINSDTAGHVSYSRQTSNIYGINFRTAGGVSSKISIKNVQIEFSESETEYEDFNGTSYPIDWTSVAGTVYGGSIDVLTGVLTVTDGYIASYNGETLPSTWISDRDVYAEGTTPTTGAEVVYKLAEPVEYALTPVTDIATLDGICNVFCTTGDATMTYTALV